MNKSYGRADKLIEVIIYKFNETNYKKRVATKMF